MINKKYGKLLVVRLDHIKTYPTFRRKHFLCICDCGVEVVVSASNLYSGHTSSCGCLQRDSARIKRQTHALSKTRFYKTWAGMLFRCKTKARGYKDVFVCDRWKEFQNFYNDMHESYQQHVVLHGEKDTTIDRIDNSHGYCPSNCRWATHKVQANNTSKSVVIEYNGEVHNYTEWIQVLGLNKSTITYRVARGMSHREALGLI